METQTTNNGALFKRIAAVMAAVRSLPKDGRNTQNNYDYVSSDRALEHIGKAMAQQGLVIIPTILDYETVDETPKGASIRTRTRVRFEMHICDSDGNAFAAPWAAEGTDYGNPDRALNKAMTNATKYFLLKLFVVGAGGDDPDGEATEAATATKPQPRQQAKPAQAKPRDTASQAQLNRLHKVGTDLYGDAWDEERHRLVQHVTKGAIESSNDLTPKECDTLIAGIERKLAAQTQDKFDGTPEQRGAKPLASNGASKAMRQRVAAQEGAER